MKEAKQKKLNNKIHVIPSERSKQFIENFNKNKPTEEFIESCKKAGELFGGENDKSTDQNVADVPIDDLVSRAEVLALINTAMFSIDNRGMQDYIFNGLRRKVHNLPSAEPSGDLVSREEAKREIYLLGENPSINDIWNCIDALPSAEYSKPLQTTLNGDLVSREEALDVVCKELQYQEENRIPYDSYDSGTCYGLKTARELLLALPSAEQTIIGIDIPYGSDKGLATVFKSKDDKLILEKVKEICLDDFADRPTLKQTDTMIIADALRYLIQDTERHELDRTRAEELREQILQYGASMCSSAERPMGEWIFNPKDAIELMFTKPKCSECGFESSDGGNYCPNCGARMKGEKDD